MQSQLETPAASTTEAVPFSALLMDGVDFRANGFLLKGSGEPFRLRIVRTRTAAEEELLKKWDVVFTSLFLGAWDKPLELVPALVSAWREKRVNLIICTSPIQADAERFVRALRREGIPVKWIPHRYDSPNNHTPTLVDGK